VSLRPLPRLALALALLALSGCARSVFPDDGSGAGRRDGTTGDGISTGGCPGNCGDGFRCCEGRCVNLAESPNNCGGCGMRCDPQNQVCQDAICVPAELCTGAGGCSNGACCAERVCCPSGTRCVIDLPTFVGCCPNGEDCGGG
jgi:hypothetical protein